MVKAANNMNSWTVEQLKKFLHDQNNSLAGSKPELVRKVDIIAMDGLERELGPLQFQTVDYTTPPCFNVLSAATEWVTENFPIILENSCSLPES